MAKKKGLRKKTTIRVVKRNGSSSKQINTKSRTTLILHNLLLFIALSLVSFVFYRFVQNDFFENLFFIMAIIFGFVSVGFLITLLILLIIKFISKKGTREGRTHHHRKRR